MKVRYRQEVLNVALAQLLQERGLVSAPEIIIKHDLTGQRMMPDVLVDFLGLRVALEGEVDDQAEAEQRALASATRRVEDGIAHIGVAVVYPQELRGAGSLQVLRDGLAHGNLRIAVVSESGPSGFAEGGLDCLENALRAAFDALVREDVVTEAAQVIDAAVARFALNVATKEGTITRIAEALEMSDLSDEMDSEAPEEE